MKSQKADHNNYKLALVVKAPEASQMASQRLELPLFPSQSLTLADHTDPTPHHSARTISSKAQAGFGIVLRSSPSIIIYAMTIFILIQSCIPRGCPVPILLVRSLPSLSIKECITPGFVARSGQYTNPRQVESQSGLIKIQIPEIMPFCNQSAV